MYSLKAPSSIGEIEGQKTFPAVLARAGLQLPREATQNKPRMNKILTGKLAGSLFNAEITQIAEDRLKEAGFDVPVVIRDNVSSVLPAAANNGGRYAGMAWKGKVYLFRDELGSASDVVVTLWHELLTGLLLEARKSDDAEAGNASGTYAADSSGIQNQQGADASIIRW